MDVTDRRPQSVGLKAQERCYQRSLRARIMPRIVSDYRHQARDRILAAGRVVFLRRGYRNATMDEIAQGVDVTKADLYHYFPSKAALLREIGKAFPQEFNRRLGAAIKNARSAGQLADVVMQVLSDEGPEVHRLWFDMMAESANDAETEAFMSRLNREYLRALTSALPALRAVSWPAKAAPLPASAALSVLFLIQGALASLRVGIPRAQVRAALRSGLTAILSK